MTSNNYSTSPSLSDGESTLLRFDQTISFSEIDPVSNQERIYRSHNASENVMTLVRLKSRSFGAKIEKIVREIFGFSKCRTTHYDHVYPLTTTNVRIEQKSSRYWMNNNKLDFKWQHIEPKHEFDILLLVGVSFRRLRYYILTKQEVEDLINAGVITKQGGGDGQGYWVNLNDIKSYYRSNNSRFHAIRDTHIQDYIRSRLH